MIWSARAREDEMMVKECVRAKSIQEAKQDLDGGKKGISFKETR